MADNESPVNGCKRCAEMGVARSHAVRVVSGVGGEEDRTAYDAAIRRGAEAAHSCELASWPGLRDHQLADDRLKRVEMQAESSATTECTTVS